MTQLFQILDDGLFQGSGWWASCRTGSTSPAVRSRCACMTRVRSRSMGCREGQWACPSASTVGCKAPENRPIKSFKGSCSKFSLEGFSDVKHVIIIDGVILKDFYVNYELRIMGNLVCWLKWLEVTRSDWKCFCTALYPDTFIQYHTDFADNSNFKIFVVKYS